MKNLVLLLTVAAIIMLSCTKTTDEIEPIITKTHPIPIEINVDGILQNANPGEEVTQFVAMHVSGDISQIKSTGTADLLISVSPGDEIVWNFAEQYKDHTVKIVGFEFTIVEGENFFEMDGAYLPIKQADESWIARISPDAYENSKLKYSVYFTIDGIEYWWDPFISVRSDDPE